jgi:hypothetical protein
MLLIIAIRRYNFQSIDLVYLGVAVSCLLVWPVSYYAPNFLPHKIERKSILNGPNREPLQYLSILQEDFKLQLC